MNKLLYIFVLALLCILQINAEEISIVNTDVEVVTEVVTEAVKGPPTIHQFNAQELEDFVNNNEIVVVAYLKNLQDNGYAYFNGIAYSLQEYDHLNFVVTTDDESQTWTSEKLGVQITSPEIVLFKQGNGYAIPFDKIQSKSMYNVRELCLKALNPYVDELEGAFGNFNFDYILYFYRDEEDKIAKYDLMHQLAVQYFQEFQVKYINMAHNPLNLSPPELTSKFIIVSKSIQAYYRQIDILSEEDETNFENISYFVNAYKSSMIDPLFLWRSEEMNWEFTDYVTEIRPNIYDSVVNNPKTDVIVLYYKSDCPYSQQVMKSFQDLAKRYITQRDKLTVAQFEAENQNIPEISIWRNLVEYPTIVLYPASRNGKKRQYYVMGQQLGRSAINIASWILKRANNSYEEVLYSPSDYEKLKSIDGGYIVQNKEEEEAEIRTNKLLADPDLIFTVFGEGKDQKYYSVENEENNYYIGNTEYAELPLTGAYYELTSTTYKVHYAEPTNSAKEIARQNALKKQQQ